MQLVSGAPNSVGQALFVFVGGYLGLTFALALVLRLCADTTQAPSALARIGAGGINPASTRALLAVLLATLAGLPPFFYFFSKLGLLGALLAAGNPVVVLACLCAVLVGWVVYLRALLLLLRPQAALPGSPLWVVAPSALRAVCCVVCVLCLCLGACTLEDSWVLLA